jgi:hypothetical protein
VTQRKGQAMTERRVVRSIWSADQKHRLDIFRRPDGHFGYAGESQVTEDGETYWNPTDMSGIYETAEEAEKDALVEVPWLRNLKPN